MLFRSNRMNHAWALAWVLALGAPATWAQQATTAAAPPAEEPVDTIEEVIVVSASRTEQRVAEAPATVTVLTSQDIAQTPADDYGDLLRNVPGLERRADQRPRHPDHRPRLDQQPRHLAAGDARRAFALPRLLRLRDVGLPAGQHHRDQADRGGARTG